MGIPQLLPFLESATEPKHISAFRGQKCAIDGYAWLHKASMTCAMEMARGTPTRKFVDFCMKLLNMIRSHGVEPIIVFDDIGLWGQWSSKCERRLRCEDHCHNPSYHRF